MIEGEKSYYSVEGNYQVGEEIVFEERKYLNASSFEGALLMAREDGNIGSGMVFQNLGDAMLCNLGMGKFINQEKLSINKLTKMAVKRLN